MRLGETAPISLDDRNQLLRDIAYGRGLLSKGFGRTATIPADRPLPYEGDQPAYDAAAKAVQQTDPIVTALETRLKASVGPYWKDLTQQEKDAFALWTEAAKQIDAVSYKHFPSPLEMDFKKAILMVIGVGAFFVQLLLTKEEDTGFPFRVLPKPPELPFDRAPRALPMRSEVPALPYRGSTAIVPVPGRGPAFVTATPIETPVGIPAVAARSGYSPPPRFSKGFAPSPVGALPARGAVMPSGLPSPSGPGREGRFIYPKPTPS
jgi:hypothetical protein